MVFCSGQGQLKVSPVNPDYQQFLNSLQNSESGQAAPSPIQPGFKQYFIQKKNNKSPLSFPLVYDMRIAGAGGTSLLTPVKHQLSCGACWSFATMSSIESVWKMNGLGDFDLSENNLKNCHGFVPNACSWGHHFMSTAYLVRGSGPIAEVDDIYDPLNSNCTGGLTPLVYIPESWYLPEDPDAFKAMIMDHGAVYNTYKSVSADYSWINGHLTYCYIGDQTTTHAIAIVGWNDTITTNCGQGAWICKNEYGVTFGEQGYFYISYLDSLVLKYNAIWPYREEYNPDQIIYQYDSLGGWPSVGYSDSIAYGLVRFDVAGDEYITRIGTYTVSWGSKLQIEIYDDFDGTSVSNLLAAIPDIFVEFPGFHTIDLLQPLRRTPGDDIYIQVKYNSPGEIYPIAVEGFSDTYTFPIIETGKCWSREESGPWEAWGIGTTAEFDICIKAYAFPVMKLNVKAFLEGPFNGTTMDTLLNDILPNSQPYASPPWNYTGTETISGNAPAGTVDWVLVELRETNGSAQTATFDKRVAQQACMLRKDGQLLSVDGDSLLKFDINCTDSLFVVIYHRNHLPIISAIAVSKNDGIYTLDFTSSAAKALGGNLAQKDLGGGIFGMISGDASSDNLIDSSDKSLWDIFSGKSGYLNPDINLDRNVNNVDKNSNWVPNVGRSSQVPQ